MNAERECDNCGEELRPNLVQRGGKVYCCEACAFEAQRRLWRALRFHNSAVSSRAIRKVRFGLPCCLTEPVLSLAEGLTTTACRRERGFL
jgi:hypothetical protein